HQKRRSMAKLHLFAGFDRQRSYPLGGDLGHKLRDATGDLHAVLIKLRLPEKAGQYRAPQLKLMRNVACRRAFVGTSDTSKKIQPCHGWLLAWSCARALSPAEYFC